MAILEAHAFSLRVRRFVLDLFDRDMVRRFVLNNEDEEVDDSR